MEDKIRTASWLKVLTYVFIGIGIISFVLGFMIQPERAWANYLLNNYYFLAAAIGASFFMALQYITQSGWSSGFKRVPEALAGYIPVAAVFFLLLFFGIHSLYHWSHSVAVQNDPLLQHKSAFLNVPFFMIRLVLYFGLWIFMTRILRRLSLKEDAEGGVDYFHKSEFNSKIYIFILALTFSMACFDWLMSLDPHWYSTIFAFKGFASAFHQGATVVLLIVLILNRAGYFPFFNRNHLQDFSTYVFMLAIIYGYLWFSQFMLIWYGNIPEETIYYAVRWGDSWKPFFWADVIINWAIPFVILMPKKPARSKAVVIPILLLLLVGKWIELYLQIFPGILSESHVSWLEVGAFLGYAGLFARVVMYGLEKAPSVPRNHPYLEECLDHHVH